MTVSPAIAFAPDPPTAIKLQSRHESPPLLTIAALTVPEVADVDEAVIELALIVWDPLNAGIALELAFTA